MPMDRHLYPDNWDEIATAIKTAANWHCQNCGKPCCPSGTNFWDFTAQLAGTQWDEILPDEEELILMEPWEVRSLRASFTLTVAHLNHRPEDCRPENLRALCSVCHLQYDAQFMGTKKRLKAERQGQMTLFPEIGTNVQSGGVNHA